MDFRTKITRNGYAYETYAFFFVIVIALPRLKVHISIDMLRLSVCKINIFFQKINSSYGVTSTYN